MYPFIDFFGRT